MQHWGTAQRIPLAPAGWEPGPHPCPAHHHVGRAGGESGQNVPLGPQWDSVHQLLEAMPKQLLAQAASQVSGGG